MGEVEDTFKRLGALKGVTGVMAITSDGIVVRSTMDQPTAVHYASVYGPLVQETRMAVKELGGNTLKTIRLRTTKHEVIVIPGKEVSPKLRVAAAGSEPACEGTFLVGVKYSFVVLQQPDASFDSPS